MRGLNSIHTSIKSFFNVFKYKSASGQKKLKFTRWWNYDHNMQALHAYAQYQTFLVKCQKDKKL